VRKQPFPGRSGEGLFFVVSGRYGGCPQFDHIRGKAFLFQYFSRRILTLLFFSLTPENA
jgi:hypothetical protein